MRVLLIGGSGHIGGYLAAHFAGRGDEVVILARGCQPVPHGARLVAVDRAAAEAEPAADGVRTRWQALIEEIAADCVVDLIAYEASSTVQTLAAVRRRARHFINIGSGWRLGEPATLPTREDDLARPRCHYGEQKQAMWEAIRREFQENGLAATQIDPPAIQGPPKIPNGPTGLRLAEVHQEIADGATVGIPGTGETILGMVHVADVARLVALAVDQRDRAAGEVFNVTSGRGITYNGLFALIRDFCGSESTCEHMPLDEFEKLHPDRTSRHHTLYHQLLCGEKARRVLGFEPSVDLEDAVRESLQYQVNCGRLRLSSQRRDGLHSPA
jgi:nucleoside-diphosphate-sugar epimerase